MWIIVLTNFLTSVLMIVGIWMMHAKLKEIQQRMVHRHHKTGLQMDYLVVAVHVIALLAQNALFGFYYWISIHGKFWDSFFTAHFVLIAILDTLVCCIICNIQF